MSMASCLSRVPAFLRRALLLGLMLTLVPLPQLSVPAARDDRQGMRRLSAGLEEDLIACRRRFSSSPLLPLTLAVAQSSQQRCHALAGVPGIPRESLGPNFFLSEAYFCADSAPAHLACRCSFMEKCTEARDPWSRNMGRCSCCQPWLWVLIALISLAFALMLAISAAYAHIMRHPFVGYGYPRPVEVCFVQRMRQMPCPEDQPLPEGLFRGYPSEHFANYYSAEYQQRQQKDNQDAGAENSPGRYGGGTRRRRGQGSDDVPQRLRLLAQETPLPHPFEKQLERKAGDTAAMERQRRAVEPFAAEESDAEEARRVAHRGSPAELTSTVEGRDGNQPVSNLRLPPWMRSHGVPGADPASNRPRHPESEYGVPPLDHPHEPFFNQ